MNRFADHIQRISTRGKIVRDFPMSKLSWFRVGGIADILFQPADTDDLRSFLLQIPKGTPITIVGLGSNLLVRDGGIEGIVINLPHSNFNKIERLDSAIIKVETGVADKHLAQESARLGIGNLEFFYGVPGTIGGALRTNAGANGGDTAQLVMAVDAIDFNGNPLTLTASDMNYSYRHCSLRKEVIFISTILSGSVDSSNSIHQKILAVQQHRESAQPVRARTCGSTFKNPPGASAWQLIDKVGMRGHKIGGAQISPLHCNFIIADPGAKASDIENLGELARQRVAAETGILLEWEIERIGRKNP